ncbi:MAG TPA: methyltransferase domain-containing protein [Polyangia bacterium]|nr:methyltransferase domain-containing protein [Polyangia bacterium]
MADDADTYTFGDTDLAAERLRILARAFEPTSRAFLARVRARAYGEAPVALAVDLGCGPGYTTCLVRDVMAAAVTTGIDRSPRFLARAALRAADDLRFVAHDVTAPPPAAAGADLLYARFLLTHLARPAAALRAWADVAAPGAHLLLEETAALTSAHPALARYHALVGALQRAHGQDMTIGRTLARLASGTGWIVRQARVTRARLPARLMARIHVMNLRTWRNDRHAARVCDGDELETLDAALERLACGRDPAPPVDCRLGQVWLTRAATSPPFRGAPAPTQSPPGQ